MGTKDLAQVRTFYYRTIKSINKALEEAVSRGHPKEGEALEVLMVKNSGAPGEDSACEYADSHAIMVGWWRAREKEGYTGDGALAKLARKPMKRKRFTDTILKAVLKIRRQRERLKQKAAQRAAQAGAEAKGAAKRGALKRSGASVPSGSGGRGGARGAAPGGARGGGRADHSHPAGGENGRAEVPSSSSDELPEKLVIQLLPRESGMGSSLRARGHNPQLELTLSHKKSMASILRHLVKKWRLREGERLVLSVPAYRAQQLQHLPPPKKFWQMNQLKLMGQLENFERLEKLQWGPRDTDITAAMVFAFLVAPSPFQLDYHVADSLEEEGGDTASCLEQPSFRGHDRSSIDMPARSLNPATSEGVTAWLDGQALSVPGASIIDHLDFPMDSAMPAVDGPFTSSGLPGRKNSSPSSKRRAQEEPPPSKSRRKNLADFSPPKNMKGMGELPETSLGMPSPLTFNTMERGMLGDLPLGGEPIVGIESRLETNGVSSRGGGAGETSGGKNPMERFFPPEQPMHAPGGEMLGRAGASPKYGSPGLSLQPPPKRNRLNKLMGEPEGLHASPPQHQSQFHAGGPPPGAPQLHSHGLQNGGGGRVPEFSTEPFPRLGTQQKPAKAPKRIRPTRLGPPQGAEGMRPQPVNVPGSEVARAAQMNGSPLGF